MALNFRRSFADLGPTNYQADVIARHTLAGVAGFDILPGQLDHGRRADDWPEARLMRDLVLGVEIADLLTARQPSEAAATARLRRTAGIDAERWIEGDTGALISLADACVLVRVRQRRELHARQNLGSRATATGHRQRLWRTPL